MEMNPALRRALGSDEADLLPEACWQQQLLRQIALGGPAPESDARTNGTANCILSCAGDPLSFGSEVGRRFTPGLSLGFVTDIRRTSGLHAYVSCRLPAWESAGTKARGSFWGGAR